MADIQEFLKIMVDRGASDLHITVGSPPMIRVNGELNPLPYPALGQSDTKNLCYSLLTDGQKHRFEEDWELDFSFAVRGLSRFRGNLFNQKGAVGGAFRTIPYQIRGLAELGLPPVVGELTKQPRGLVLVTGPTGSGKSTTLASMVDKVNMERREHIMTVEDPIEFVHEHKRCVINQREVLADTKSFADSLKHVLRQDPDVCLVGEMRDLETMEAALVIAETGHLVFSTLHTNDAASSITRLVDLGIQPFLISSSLVGAMAQRLVRKICQDCKRNRPLSLEEAAMLNLQAPAGKRIIVKEGAGCIRCRNTGYFGRSGIFEILPVDNPIRDLIDRGEDFLKIKETAIKRGMRSLRQSALRKLAEGVTSFEEVVRVTGI